MIEDQTPALVPVSAQVCNLHLGDYVDDATQLADRSLDGVDACLVIAGAGPTEKP